MKINGDSFDFWLFFCLLRGHLILKIFIRLINSIFM